ncbi:hypothetical protein D9613_008233 [Agrocybe pediades]|uniref:CxC5 like cysteine cluster associated with KDZ domain-containing protein n=1 Tax=Agrocybe pediades TaxID=84607 RepID=A0A8H4QTZ6_9AGAR|nr:hypothetical protein D9613_008233 [Agrocybe pediades]
MLAAELLEGLESHPTLRFLTLDGVFTLSRILGHLKRSILQPQPISESNPSHPPQFLPEHLQNFIREAIDLPANVIDDLWRILRHHIWTIPTMPLMEEDRRLFKVFGWKWGVTAMSIYPPEDVCTNSNCEHCIPLKKSFVKKAVVYTQSHGVQPAWVTSLYCPKCHTSYHNNFAVNAGIRTYYSGIPEFVQVGEHQFVEGKLGYTWRANMLYGWFSASNTSRVYRSSMTDISFFDPLDWGLSDTLTTAQVWDSFVILGLLEDSVARSQPLLVPHTGDQADRFKRAMDTCSG